MLLSLLIQQPSILGQILQNTPVWVWALLIGLLGLGGTQLFGREVTLVRAMAMPIAMTGLSVYGLASAFGKSEQAGAALVAWLVAALLITALALWFQPTAAKGTLYTSSSRSFYIPGSAVPLALIIGIFLIKYGVGVELAMQPSLAHDGRFALQIAALYGVFNGLFAARSLRLWRLARKNAALAASAVSA